MAAENDSRGKEDIISITVGYNFRVRNDSYTGGSRCGNRIINGYEHAREISPGGAQLLETPPEVREEAKPTTERKVG